MNKIPPLNYRNITKYAQTNRLHNLICQKGNINDEIRHEKRLLHLKFEQEHHGMLLLCDTMMILMVISNFLALAFTNILVAEQTYDFAEKNNITVKVIEANQVTAKIQNLETPQTKEGIEYTKRVVSSFLKQCFYWFIVLFGYIYLRMKVYKTFTLVALMAITLYGFIIYTSDFWLDFGLWLGKIIYGG